MLGKGKNFIRSVTPEERYNIGSASHVQRGRDFHNSQVISRVNSHSLTPTKITFSYQNKPVDTVAWIENRQSIISEPPRGNAHLK